MADFLAVRGEKAALALLAKPKAILGSKRWFSGPGV
jgi:hypothetical protein